MHEPATLREFVQENGEASAIVCLGNAKTIYKGELANCTVVEQFGNRELASVLICGSSSFMIYLGEEREASQTDVNQLSLF